jgi:predicted outer membrane protein
MPRIVFRVGRMPVLSSLVLLTLAGACHANRDPDVGPIVEARSQVLSESALARLVLLSHNAQRSNAELAASRSARPDVQALARRVATDHAALNDRFTALLDRIDLAPSEDSYSAAFRDRSLAYQRQLRDADAQGFDSTYAAVQVQSLREMRDLVEQQLMPNARRPELRQYLGELRPAVNAHLASAQQVQATLAAR